MGPTRFFPRTHTAAVHEKFDQEIETLWSAPDGDNAHIRGPVEGHPSVLATAGSVVATLGTGDAALYDGRLVLVVVGMVG